MISDAALDWLMNWYSAQCDEDWEHQYGVKLETLDNPGWSLIIEYRALAEMAQRPVGAYSSCL